jgi:hypothetical protein
MEGEIIIEPRLPVMKNADRLADRRETARRRVLRPARAAAKAVANPLIMAGFDHADAAHSNA